MGRGCVCFSFKRYRDKIFVFRTEGNLFPPFISTAVRSVNTPLSSHKPLLSFGNSQIHLVSRYTTQPVSGLSFLCGRGHRCLMWGSPKSIGIHCMVRSPSAGSRRPEPLSLCSGFFLSNMVSGGCAQELASHSEEPRRGQGASFNAFLVITISPVLRFHLSAKPILMVEMKEDCFGVDLINRLCHTRRMSILKVADEAGGGQVPPCCLL